MKDITPKKIICNLLEIASGAFFIVCTVLVLINVFLRYFLNTGLYWSEEICTSCFVWGVYLGAAACYKRQMHLGVDVIVKRLPSMIQKIVTIIVDILLIVLNAYITYESYVYVSLSHTKPTAVLNVSTAFISTSLVISFACMTLFSVNFLIQDLTGRRNKG
jgi:TRAP-type C4-dicarboxylate transport system permease small subunit